MLFEHDKIMSQVLLNMQETLKSNSDISATLLTEHMNMLGYITQMSEDLSRLDIENQQLSEDIVEAAIILRKIISTQ